ncbi:hypothetical protein [Pinisolibacter sp.]|uniref:hypothetical protein n=1 Tax=Pinisolibacter sp. TaxID=2172024 RepID=UPI002FDDC98A
MTATSPSARREPARGSTRAAVLFAVLAGAFLSALAHAGLSGGAAAVRRTETRALVAELGLTDLALFTEARYTRNPSLADLQSAFQDGPLTFEHFPSGSLVAPPHDLGRGRIETPAE